MTIRQRILRKLVNLYPPFLGAGIRIKFDDTANKVTVSMKLTWYNRNYVGTHFGGSLYTMCDPFYMILLMDILGKEYIVWDKSAKIEFLKPGRSTVHAEFYIPDDLIEQIKKEVNEKGKAVPEFVAQVKDENNEVVARVHKYIYIRKKDQGIPVNK
jgi:acyl-coenzyme A thioesterase PaaI-like protein